MTVHSNIVGGSSARRVIACPGSVQLCQEAPEQTASPYAQEGSALHDIMESWLVEYENGGRAPHSFIGQHHMGVEITQALYDKKLKPCVDFFENDLDPDEWLCENVVNWGEKIPGAFGTADILWRKGDRVGILDWKFGDGVAVSAQDNAQLLFYLGAAVRHTFPDFFKGATEYEGHIFQPFEDGRPPHTWAAYCDADLAEFEDLLAGAIETSKRNDPVLTIGDHCRWCAARAFCPKLRDVAAGAVEKPTKGMTRDELLEWLAMADDLEGWIKELRAYALDYQRRNGDLTGWKIVDTLGNRRFRNQKEAEAWARERKILVREFMITKFASPAQMERVMKARGLEKDAPDFLELIERPVTGEKLVPESAKGEPKQSAVALLNGLGAQLKAMNLRGSV